MPPKKPAPESKVKRASIRKQTIAAQLAAKKATKAAANAIQKDAIKRSLKYQKEYNAKERTLVSLRRTALKHNNFFMEPQGKVLFVVRIRGIQRMDPKSRKILQVLRLRQINNGIFIRVNKATMGILRKVEAYITYGYPSVATIRKLVLKRGHLKIKNQRIRITDNAVVTQALGKQGVHSVEDIVHQIATAGPEFTKVSNTLWPFKLSHQRGGLKEKRRHFIEGGDWGNREEYINDFIKKGL